MTYNKTDLPEKVQMYLEEIFNDEDLLDAFFNCDIEIYDEDWILDLDMDEELQNLMGPNDCGYESIKAFARDGSGALWVVLNDEYIGYIGTEGECGIVARNIDEFMNMAALGRYVCEYWDMDILLSEDDFAEKLAEPVEDENDKKFVSFIEKHGFTTDAHELYEMIIKGLTVEPALFFPATEDGEYCDSNSLLGFEDGQESLEELKKLIK